MASRTSQLIVSLIDKISGPAKGAAAGLKGLTEAEKKLAAGAKGARRWGDDFQRQIEKIKLSSAAVAKLAADYDKLQGMMRGNRASVALGAMQDWHKQTLAGLRAVGREQEAAIARQERLNKGFKGGARFAAGLASAYVGAHAVESGVKGAVKAASARQREAVRYDQMGFTPDEGREAGGVADRISQKYPSLSRTDVLTDLRKNASRLGGFDRAKEIAEAYAQARISNKLSGGDEHELEQVVRAAEGAGAANTPEQFKTFLNAFARAKAANPDYTGEEFGKDFRAAGAAKYGLGRDYMENVFPVLASHTSGFGVKLATSNSALIGGRQTKQAKAKLKDAGLLGEDGKLLDEAGYQENPFAWTQKYVKPILEKQGVHFGEHMSEEDKRKTSAWATKSFSAKNAADQIITNLLDAPLVERARQRKTLGIDAAGDLQKKDPALSFEGAKTQITDLTTALINLGPATTALNAFSAALSKMTTAFSTGSTGDKAGALIGAGLLGSAAAAGGVMAAKGAYQWFTGAGALMGSAAALDASAAALTAAAAQLSAGSLASKAAAATAAGGAAAGAGSGAAAGGGLAAAGAIAARAATLAPPVAATVAAVLAAPMIRKSVEDAGYVGKTSGERMAEQRGGSLTEARRRAFNEDRARLGIPAASGTNGDSVWEKGTSAIEHLDQSSEAAAAGTATGDAYKAAVAAALAPVDALIQAKVQQWVGMLSFSASPTITPKIGDVSTPGKGASLDGAAAKHAAFADYGFDTA